MNQELYNEGVFMIVNGDRSSTRSRYDILPGQIVFVRRGMDPDEQQILVSFLSKLTERLNSDNTYTLFGK